MQNPAILFLFFLLTTSSLAATPFGGDDKGFLPSNAVAAKCEATVATAYSNLAHCIIKCHMKRVSAFRKGRIFDEEGCEAAAPHGCLGIWKLSLHSIFKNGACPPCLVSGGQVLALGFDLESFLADRNGRIYCASTDGAFVGERSSASGRGR